MARRSTAKSKLIKIVAGSIVISGFVVFIVGPGIIIEKIGPNRHLFELVMQERGSNSSERALALEELSKSSSTSVPYLISLLNNFDWYIRCKATRTLGELGEPAKGSIPKLILLLNDSDMSVRYASIDALGKMGKYDASVIPPLIHSLSSSNTRLQSVRALGEMNESAKVAVPSLRLMLQDFELPVRRAAIEALGKIGEPAEVAIPDLIPFLNAPEPAVQEEAVEALRKLKYKP